jgi:RNA polymerase sigma factor (sigma-70 family)
MEKQKRIEVKDKNRELSDWTCAKIRQMRRFNRKSEEHRQIFNQIYMANKDLVQKFVHKYCADNVDKNLRDQLVAAGEHGLIEAILSFDESKGVTFGTYAVPTIKGYILNFINDSQLIPLSSHLAVQMAAARRGEEEYFDKYKGEKRAIDPVVLSLAKGHLSLDLMMSEENEGEDKPGWEIGEPSFDMEMIDNDFVKQALSILSDQERDVIIRHFLLSQTLKTIAKSYGVSTARIGQIKRDALEKMRRRFGWTSNKKLFGS